MSRKKNENEAVLDAAAGGEEGVYMPDPDPSGEPMEKARAARKGRNQAPEGETKASKFKRLANRRVPRALKALQHVRNLTNRSQYAYTPQQSERIIEVLGVACQQVFAGFKGADSVAEEFFV